MIVTNTTVGDKQAEADLGMFGRTGAPTRAHWPKITTLLRNIQ